MSLFEEKMFCSKSADSKIYDVIIGIASQWKLLYLQIHPVSCTNTHHDVTDLVNHGMVKNTKIWISWECNIIFLWNTCAS